VLSCPVQIQIGGLPMLSSDFLINYSVRANTGAKFKEYRMSRR